MLHTDFPKFWAFIWILRPLKKRKEKHEQLNDETIIKIFW